MLAFNERRIEQLVSRTAIAGLDLVLSNDDRGELNTLLLHAPDGRLRLRHLLPVFRTHYDLLLIDTQGARSVLLEMAVLASDLALSPVTPEILAARELRRGTLQLIEDIAPYRHLGIEPPPLRLLINRVHPVSSNARLIQQALRQVFRARPACRCWTPTCRPSKPIRALRHGIAGAPGGVPAAGWAHGARGVGDHAHAGRRAVPRVAGALRTGHRAGRCGRGRPWRARMNWRAAANGCAR
jgi:hypothetical protein